VWIALQFVLTLILLAAALAWTRLPDKTAWQVLLTLFVPVLLAICVLELQAGTVRKLASDDGRRVKLVWGAMAMLLWIAVGAAFWALLDWCDNQIPLWSGYLNAQSPAAWRARILTYDHIQRGLLVLEWILRWVIVPGKLIALAAASTQWGLKLPFVRLIRLLLNWRWWAGVLLAALAGVWLPAHFFGGAPKGTVSTQVWSVGLKLAACYMLAIGSWVLLLAWWATLMGPRKSMPPEEEPEPVGVRSSPPRDWSNGKIEILPPEDKPEI
jgi:hypothetical protein